MGACDGRIHAKAGPWRATSPHGGLARAEQLAVTCAQREPCGARAAREPGRARTRRCRTPAMQAGGAGCARSVKAGARVTGRAGHALLAWSQSIQSAAMCRMKVRMKFIMCIAPLIPEVRMYELHTGSYTLHTSRMNEVVIYEPRTNLIRDQCRLFTPSSFLALSSW